MTKNTTKQPSQIQQIFELLMTGAEPTPLDVFTQCDCMSANQRFSDLCLKYNVPVKSESVILPNGKRVNKHWLEPFYIDGIQAGTITPPSFYTGE